MVGGPSEASRYIRELVGVKSPEARAGSALMLPVRELPIAD